MCVMITNTKECRDRSSSYSVYSKCLASVSLYFQARCKLLNDIYFSEVGVGLQLQ